jgi:hypothetical protein
MASPSHASLCPPATPWKTTTGFQPTSAAAKAARSGIVRLAAATTISIVATLARAARSLYANAELAGASVATATPADAAVKAGPYTEGESSQSTETYGYEESDANAPGISVYGFAP